MGSLMAGWDSHVPDPKLDKLRRNKSLTKEEIETYWKTKKQREEEHLRDISLLSPRTQKIIFEEAAERSKQETGSELLPTMERELLESETSLDKLILKNGWWISSSSAFLNEPPVIAPEGTRQKYASQFHVAHITTGSTAPQAGTGISA